MTCIGLSTKLVWVLKKYFYFFTGIRWAFILTHIDKLSPDLQDSDNDEGDLVDNINNVFDDPLVGDAVNKITQLFGIKPSDVIPIKVYWQLIDIKEDTCSIDLIVVLCHI